MIKAVVFDLDDTLITSPLDLNIIRKQLGMEKGTPILEYIKLLPEADQGHANNLVLEHEISASSEATLNPGVTELLEYLKSKDIKVGLFTRNCLAAAQNVIKKFSLNFDMVITRECAPPKPSPDGLLRMLKNWGLAADEVIYTGDFFYDIEVGKRAGVKTALYVPDVVPEFANEATIVFSTYGEYRNQLSELIEP